MNPREKSLQRALEDAVSRALRDNLAPLQRTADELHQAYADLVAACASTRPSNALPAMLRAQTAAASLAAGLSVLSNFVAVALNPREDAAAQGAAGVGLAEEGPAPAAEFSDPFAQQAHRTPEPEPEPLPEHLSAPPAQTEQASESVWPEVSESSDSLPEPMPEAPPEAQFEAQSATEPAAPEFEPTPEEPRPEELAPEAPAPVESAASPALAAQEAGHEVAGFSVAALPSEMQDLHRRANRVAKVAMQDIKLLRPKDVEAGREHKDLCSRLRGDLDKARKEYDRRFRAISEHPVDYFHHWMLEILAGGDSAALGEYPYPSTVLRH